MQGSVIFRISWTQMILNITLGYLCLINTVLCAPVMKTTPQNFTRVVGASVVLPCQIQNVTYQQVNWYFVEHMTELSMGRKILVTERNKYAFVLPVDDTSVRTNLQILNLKVSDAGHYKCYVDGTLVSVVHSLKVEGAPDVPVISAPAANFTECCRQQNMTQSCLPVCNPSTVDMSTFDPMSACFYDLEKLLRCFSDGRNHAGCCRRRLVPTECLDFCLDHPITLSLSQMKCLNVTNDIISCFEEGQVLLPGPPTEVSVLSIPINTVLVNWKMPVVNPSAVTGFRIFHRDISYSGKYFVSEVVAPNFTQYMLTALTGNQEYEIYVIAIGHHGSSLPSARHRVTILADAQTPNQTIDIQGCCMDKKVSPFCRVKLCHSASWSQLNPNAMMQCYSELDTIFHCLAGGRNHTPCCERNQVPPTCLGLCSGSPPPLDWTLSQCVVGMHIIDACVQEGFDSLPSAPRFPAIKGVTNISAELEWLPPSSGSAGIKSYLIQLREVQRQTSFTSLEQVTSTFIELRDLKPSTEYEVRVITVGDTASSLPSDSVIFLTYESTYSTTLPPDNDVATIHNFTACCASSNIPQECTPACSYDLATIMTFYTQNILTCINYLSEILICASDGRDHGHCCTERYVNPSCVMFCNYTANSQPLDISHIGCVGHITSILLCYEEGVVYLPKHPVNVQVVSRTTNTVLLSWEKAETGPSVDHYIVAYSEDRKTWEKYNVTTTSYIMQNLKNNTLYTVEIQSVNANGTSPPSNRIMVRTDPGVIIPPPTINGTIVDGRVIWANKRECCSKHNVSERCMPFCNGAAMVPNCMEDVASVLACSADGQDHRSCCSQIGVPQGCLSFCQGHITGKNFITAACLGWTTLISGCTIGRAGIVPSEPQNFSVEVVANHQALVRWQKPANNCAANSPCVYYLHYWRVNEEDKVTPVDGPEATTIENVTSPYTLKTLQSFTHYRVSVTAHNMYGGSRHTPSQEVYMEFYGIQDISISRSPEGVIDLGGPAKLFCDAVANPSPTITWTKDKKVVGTGRKLAINSVKEEDSGLYSCEATTRHGSKTATVFLPVLFKPVITQHRDAEVEPKKGLTAILACWFSGFPDVTTVKWLKNGHAISISPPKTKEYREIRSHTGITAVQLRIYNVVGSDYGDYMCKVSNKYGQGNGVVKLIDPTKPVRPVPSPKPKVTNVTACCIENKVESDCMVACTFDIDIKAIIGNTALFKCAVHIPAYATCAADGSDHSQCCKDEGVSDFCLPFCSGNVPDSENLMSNPRMLDCVDHADRIIGCMEKNRDYVPNAPEVHARLINGSIEINWVGPTKNGDKVKKYHVFFQAAGDIPQEHVVSSVFTKYRILHVRNHVTYNVWVVASNDYGKSLESNKVPVSVGGVPPQPPRNPYSEMVSPTKIRIRWSAPYGSTPISAYVIFFKKLTDDKYNQAHTNSMSFRLEQLDGDSSYEAYIVSQNQDGYSVPSTTIHFQTGGAISAKHSGSSGPSGTQIGLGIGLTLLVFAIIFVVLIIIYIKFRRGKGGGAMETVSFENPAYGRNQVQITGLPADATMQPSNQFTYGRLEDDYAGFEKSEQPDNQYTTVSAPNERLEVNGNNPATLPVTSDEIRIQTPSKNESTT